MTICIDINTAGAVDNGAFKNTLVKNVEPGELKQCIVGFVGPKVQNNGQVRKTGVKRHMTHHDTIFFGER